MRIFATKASFCVENDFLLLEFRLLIDRICFDSSMNILCRTLKYSLISFFKLTDLCMFYGIMTSFEKYLLSSQHTFLSFVQETTQISSLLLLLSMAVVSVVVSLHLPPSVGCVCWFCCSLCLLCTYNHCACCVY